MKSKTKVTKAFQCSLERAFKTPMLCDVLKIHVGYGFMPRVTKSIEDENWGEIRGSRKVLMAKKWGFGGGYALDTVMDRQENQYWKIQINNFEFWSMGFEKFVGEWLTKALPDGTVAVTYTYTLHSKNLLFFPFHWLICKTFWRLYMKHVLHIIHDLARKEEPYVHA